MPGSGGHPPRTVLEALVGQRRWSQQDFCDAYARAACELDLKLTVSHQHAGRWMGGKLKGLPYPSQCRVLESMFGIDVVALLGPAGPRSTPPDVARSSQWTSAERPDPDEEISMAADEAARFAHLAEQTNVGPHTLEQLAADIERIVTLYPNRPVYPLFVELRSLRTRVFETLEGRQPPAQSRDLYLIAGILTGVLANASFDLGRLDAAQTQARTAFLCAELAGSNWLRSWVRGTQALVAYWDDRALAAARLAEDGERYRPESGTAAVRLASIAARAHGVLRDRNGVEVALRRAEAARAAVTGADEPGGMMEFPIAKQCFYAATARLWLGDRDHARQAREDAQQAVALYEQELVENRRLGELNLARLDIATAHLALDQVDGMVDDVRLVLSVSRRRPTSSVSRRLSQLDAALNGSRYATSAIASVTREEIRGVLTGAARPAVPALRGEATT